MVQHPSPRKWHGRPGYISWPKTVPLTQPSQQAVQVPHCRAPAAVVRAGTCLSGTTAPQHFLYFFPLPQGQGSFRPIAIGEESSACARSVYFERLKEDRESSASRGRDTRGRDLRRAPRGAPRHRARGDRTTRGETRTRPRRSTSAARARAPQEKSDDLDTSD